MNDASMSMDAYVTQDLPLAATLVVLGQHLIDIERTNPRRAGFCFSNSKQLQELVELFQTGQLVVEPRSYFDAIRHVKNRLYGD